MHNRPKSATPADFSALMDNPAFGELFSMVRDDLMALFPNTAKHELADLQDKIRVLGMIEQKLTNEAYQRGAGNDAA